MSALRASESEWLRAATGSRVVEFYAAIGVELPNSHDDEAPVRCFANPGAHKHDDRNKSCSVNLLTGLFKCHGCGAKGNAYQAALALRESEPRARELAQRYGVFLEREKPRMPGERQLKKWRETLMGSPKFLGRLGELKGWTPQAIHRCGLGWDGERITFPIRGPRLKIVGLVRYLPGGSPKSKALPGSKRLLFPAPEVLNRKRPLFVVEGEPDAVSVRACDHQAVAVPGVASWRPEFAQRLAPFGLVVVIADCDPQGRELADRVCAALPKARRVEIDRSLNDGSDVGDLVADAARNGGVWQMRRVLDFWAREAA